MSAPENSNSKAPPSLLSDKAKGADGNGSRILANLEGRVAPPAEKPRRSRTPLALGALLVIAAGGWGAWHMQQREQNETLAAAAPAGAVNIAKAAAPASAVSDAVQVAANARAAAPASSQAATIIADDSDSKAAATSASAAAGATESRLSRALAAGTETTSASTPVASIAADASAGASGSAAQPVASTPKHDKRSAVASTSRHEATTRGKKESATASAGAHRSTTTTAAAQSKKSKPDTSSKDDSDADLLAALVARTKPADTKTGGSNATTKVASAAPGNAKLAERVKECGQRGFFEDQLCRWRVCDGHWGKDPACPGSTPQARQP